jgi:hypothetical protein
VTIAVYDLLPGGPDGNHVPQPEAPCPSLKIKAPRYIEMNKAPANASHPLQQVAVIVPNQMTSPLPRSKNRIVRRGNFNRVKGYDLCSGVGSPLT